eukprot:CAMPEP_0172546426 /NCGR_PEP_ID=MMETSP1067-20121228/16200_1 /TAXON_ID=265564 ORGANISM="Thalassiosira punctigera, Strain Tpunct2005C2" /NCGR_SAMPLE_ID=MMETSP1067 /ASSEMBLY_ACC=CAM_ASM_000444 /LENGTH=143 /DNA_ID=CAMNT_0013333355 /DNA_START=109 /DNA_END=537 /DNA_ORIENTATION=+
MTVDTLSSEFSIIQLDERNRLMVNDTPAKPSAKNSNPVTPDSVSSTGSSLSCLSSVSSYERQDPSGFPNEDVLVSEHKRAELGGRHAEEPLLKENPHRYVLFPIQDADIWQMYKKAEASFWTAEEIDLASDLNDWDSLTNNER